MVGSRCAPRGAKVIWNSRASAVALALACSAVSIASVDADTGAAATATLEVAITNLESDEGVLVVALLGSAEQYAASDDFFRGDDKVPIRDRKASVIFERIPYGTYAVKIFHDANSNGELDTNFVGFPKEGFGFSNDAMGRFGPPTFEEAAFEVGVEKLRIEITAK